MNGTGGSTPTVVIDLDGSISEASTPDYDAMAPVDAGPVCGNGVLETGEQCDDGNTVPGDGCDGTCQLEKGFCCATGCCAKSCGSPPTRCAAVCGDGVVSSPETCDVGANDGGNGCSATCQTQTGWSCPAAGGACTYGGLCGDGIVQTTLGEQCDDGTNDGTRGCTAACKMVVGWKCPPQGGACSPNTYCGDGTVQIAHGEQCDDHNLRSYDGCSSNCTIEPGWSCPPAGGACTRICGNGILDKGETCDDGNIYSGDGCSSTCQTETNFLCPTPGSPCVFSPPPPPAVCGNGVVELGEGCDDGNTTGGDGCSSSCKLEAGWACPTANVPCVAAKCGDGIVAGAEKCDDGNAKSDDGCSSSCQIEPNAVCSAGGTLCVPMACGDGKVTGTEECDDSNKKGGDGCSATCQIEAGWVCPVIGASCTTVCGDGIVAGREECDEGSAALDGGVPCCNAECQLMAGYVCDPSKTPHSQPASAYCGDGIVDGPSNPSSPVRGQEECDDHNVLPFDGCSPTCTNEPLCGTYNTTIASPPLVSYQCFAVCGDGIVEPGEGCDDGNTVDNDGCSSSCQVELNPSTSQPAWTCTQALPGNTIQLPVIWRDFSPEIHPQFSIDPLVDRRLPNIPQASLQLVSVGGTRLYKYVPGYNTSFVSPNWGTSGYNQKGYQGMADWTMNGPGWVSGSEGWKTPWWGGASYDLVWWANGVDNTPPQTPTLTPSGVGTASPAGRYAQWYLDVPTVNMTFPGTITLKETTATSGVYQYSCDNNGCDSAFPGNPTGFFPLDGRGWVATTPQKEKPRDGNHNYSFTTETRYWFTYAGGEQLSFFGDDDLWVFVNGTLTLDIGGIHSKLNGNFTLQGTGATSTAQVCVENSPGAGANNNCSTQNLGLVVGQLYEIAVFNAERENTGSNFQLTLKGFNSASSVCTPKCGDGYAVGWEQCDRGGANVSAAGDTWGKCTTTCTLGPYCGDGVVQAAHEVCDNGINLDAWVPSRPTSTQCGPNCTTPTWCGDGTIQATYGEQCDDGPKNANTYGHCQLNCQLGARCGDSKTQTASGEQCDDGPSNGAPSSGCDATCHFKCGNARPDAGEECDDGAKNGTAASTCDTTCHFKCGNGQLDPGEDCDDGLNDGAYGTCNSDCTFAPFCGDGTTQTPEEVCDNGTNNSATAYGPTSCTDQCLPGGFCGDGIVDGPEGCDDGQNTGLPGSCTKDCLAYVPPASCGDGTVQPPEQCDDGRGASGNGTASSKCDNTCRWKCGNGAFDTGETCDDGVNNGAYGTCTSDCQIGPHCGDGIKSGPEQCDDGAKNVPIAKAYGPGVCTTACTWAPFCGDGRIQSQFGEQCEGNLDCSNCLTTSVIIK